MSILPEGKLALLQFCESHISPWSANAAALGLTPAQVSAFSTLVEEARKDYDTSIDKRNEAKAATAQSNVTARGMRESAADLIRLIKTKAETTDDPTLYAIAQIPAPAAPSPNPPPGQPYDVVVTLDSTGAIKLSWKSENAAGGFFQVRRRIGAASTPFVNVGGTGTREFLDATLPLGTQSATYLITGYRGTAVGTASNQVTVQFGVAGGGGGAVTVTGGTLGIAA